MDITSWINDRKQGKLAAFDKDAKKRREAASEAELSALDQALAEARRELELKYEPRTWLTNAAQRAGQISLVTHAAKYTHGDAQSSSLYSCIRQQEGYLSTASLAAPSLDAVGNAAALDVAKLLQTRFGEDSLLDCLRRKEYSLLAELAEDSEQLAAWVTGFSRVLETGQPTSHTLSKQIYFPVGDGYHLLSPLFSSSLAQALHQKIVAQRFSEESKAARQARRNKQWHPLPEVSFPNTAVMNFGGTKPQNISALNSSRGGRMWLLSSQPPQWQAQERKPLAITSLFAPKGPFEYLTANTLTSFTALLTHSGNYNNAAIKRRREHYVDELIDLLFNVAAGIQRPEWCNWTTEPSCLLKPHQALWLDPWRTQDDPAFALERERGDWQAAVADDFAQWLNTQLNAAKCAMGMVERKAWRTQCQQRLREMEHVIKEAQS